MSPDVRLECEWDAIDDPEMERRALRRACACVPLDELRAVSIRAEAAVWDAHDWYDMFVGSVEITHVAGLETPGESVLDALKLPLDTTDSDTSSSANANGSGSGGTSAGENVGCDPPLPQSSPLPSPPLPPPSPPPSSSSPSSSPPPPTPPQQQQQPLFPELVSLTLVGVNFVRTSKAAWQTLSSAMTKRQASPACVTILDRIEFRGCTVAEWMVDGLNEYTAVVVWDSVSDPDNWMHVPRDVEGAADEDEEDEDEDNDDDDDDEDTGAGEDDGDGGGGDADEDDDDADAGGDGEGAGQGEGGGGV